MLSVLNLPPNAAQKGAAINTLVIAPHRELANQPLHWIRRMYAGASHTGDVSPLSANGTITNFPGALDPPAKADDAVQNAQEKPTTNTTTTTINATGEEQPAQDLTPPSPTKLSTMTERIAAAAREYINRFLMCTVN